MVVVRFVVGILYCTESKQRTQSVSSRISSVHFHSCYISICFVLIDRLLDSTCHYLHSLFSCKGDKLRSGDQSKKWRMV